MEYLVIVESPAKTKSIAKYLGANFKVMASFGHVRDLPPKEMAIDVDHNFAPTYVVTKDKIVKELTEQAKKASRIYLATDPDREGHGIAWHLSELLRLTHPKVRRMVFHEITASALKKALEEADRDGRMNQQEADSYQARRIADRLVGYQVSPQIWKQVPGATSAGRVQSVAMRMVVDKENDVLHHVAKEKYLISGIFARSNEQTFTASLEQVPKKEEEALSVLKLAQSATFRIAKVEVAIVYHAPPLPFKTSSYQQEAGKRFGISPKQAMGIAQKLYEAGKITYHRTDTMRLADVFKEAVKTYVTDTYGDEFLSEEMKTGMGKEEEKKKGEQAAHEAIRPTSVTETNLVGEFSALEQTIYRMIWIQAVASLMAKEKCQRHTATVIFSNTEAYWFVASYTFTLFLGYKILTKEEEEDGEEKNKVVSKLVEKEKVEYVKIESKQTFSEPPSRYTEPTLVKDLEKKGIGRPSTYASILDLIQSRGFVEKRKSETYQKDCKVHILEPKKDIISKSVSVTFGDKKIRLFPTDLGKQLTGFLCEHFSEMMDYQFTSQLETKLDDISHGNHSWQEIVKDVHDSIQKAVHDLPAVAKKKDKVVGELDGKPIEFAIGKFGPYLKFDGKSYSLPKGATEKPALETAKQVILSRRSSVVGQIEGGDVTYHSGKFGPYVKYKEKSYSLPKNLTDVRKVTMEDVRKVIFPPNLGMLEGYPIEFKVGQYGPYLKHNGVSVSLPKEITDITQLSPSEAKDFILSKRPIKSVEGEVKGTRGTLTIAKGPYGFYLKFQVGTAKASNLSLPNELKNDLEALRALSEEEVIRLANAPPPPSKRKA